MKREKERKKRGGVVKKNKTTKTKRCGLQANQVNRVRTNAKIHHRGDERHGGGFCRHMLLMQVRRIPEGEKEREGKSGECGARGGAWVADWCMPTHPRHWLLGRDHWSVRTRVQS